MLGAVDWNDLFSHSITADGSWNLFLHIFNDVVNSCVPIRSVACDKQKSVRYPHYIRQMLNKKAILWKCWRLTRLPADKQAYKSVATSCRAAISKFHAARELALIRKNNFGSF